MLKGQAGGHSVPRNKKSKRPFTTKPRKPRRHQLSSHFNQKVVLLPYCTAFYSPQHHITSLYKKRIPNRLLLSSFKRSIVQYLKTRVKIIQEDKNGFSQGAPYGYSIGMELGTDFSSVAVSHSLHDVQLVPNTLGFEQTPSLVYLDHTSPDQPNPGYPPFQHFKGRVFSHFRDVIARHDLSLDDLKNLGIDQTMYAINPQTNAVVTADKYEYNPVNLIVPIIDQLIQDAKRFAGHIDIPHIVLAVPAWYNSEQRYALSQVFHHLQLPNIQFIHEPVAACIANNVGREANKTVCVYHISQSSRIEVTILRADKGIFTTLSTTTYQIDPSGPQNNIVNDDSYSFFLQNELYRDQLHGKHSKPESMDELLFKFFQHEIFYQCGVDLSLFSDYQNYQSVFVKHLLKFKEDIASAPTATFRLSELNQLETLQDQQLPKQQQQQQQKQQQQQQQSQQEPLNGEYNDELTQSQSQSQILQKLSTFSYTMSQHQFKELISPLIQDYLLPISQSLAKLSFIPQNVDYVVLTGQINQHPLLHEMLTEYFGKLPTINVDPLKAIVTGAAIHSSLIAGKLTNRDIFEINPLSIGIGIQQNKFLPLIPSGAKLPFTQLITIDTQEDMQSKFGIEIYQGERDFCDRNAYIGRLDVTGIPPALRGQKRIKVILTATERGVLNVIAQELSTGATTSGSFSLPKYTPHQLGLISQFDSYNNQNIIKELTDGLFTSSQRIIIDPTGIMAPAGNTRPQDILELANPKYRLRDLNEDDFDRFLGENSFKVRRIIRTILANHGLQNEFNEELQPYDKKILDPHVIKYMDHTSDYILENDSSILAKFKNSIMGAEPFDAGIDQDKGHKSLNDKRRANGKKIFTALPSVLQRLFDKSDSVSKNNDDNGSYIHSQKFKRINTAKDENIIGDHYIPSLAQRLKQKVMKTGNRIGAKDLYHHRGSNDKERGFSNSDDPFEIDPKRQSKKAQDIGEHDRLSNYEQLYNQEQLRFLQDHGINPHTALNPENKKQLFQHQNILKYMDTVEYSAEQKLEVAKRQCREEIGKALSFLEKFGLWLEKDEQKDFVHLIDIARTMLDESDVNLIELAIFPLTQRTEALQHLTLERSAKVDEWLKKKQTERLQFQEGVQERQNLEYLKEIDLEYRELTKKKRKMRRLGANPEAPQYVLNLAEVDLPATESEERKQIEAKWGPDGEPTTSETEYPIDPRLPIDVQYQIRAQNEDFRKRRYDPTNATKERRLRLRKLREQAEDDFAPQLYDQTTWTLLETYSKVHGEHVDLRAENDAYIKALREPKIPDFLHIDQHVKEKEARIARFKQLDIPPPQDPNEGLPDDFYQPASSQGMIQSSVPSDPYIPEQNWSRELDWPLTKLLYRQGIISNEHINGQGWNHPIPTHWNALSQPFNLRGDEFDQRIRFMRKEVYDNAVSEERRRGRAEKDQEGKFFKFLQDQNAGAELSPEQKEFGDFLYSELTQDQKKDRIKKKNRKFRRLRRQIRRMNGDDDVSEDTNSELPPESDPDGYDFDTLDQYYKNRQEKRRSKFNDKNKPGNKSPGNKSPSQNHNPLRSKRLQYDDNGALMSEKDDEDDDADDEEKELNVMDALKDAASATAKEFLDPDRNEKMLKKGLKAKPVTTKSKLNKFGSPEKEYYKTGEQQDVDDQSSQETVLPSDPEPNTQPYFGYREREGETFKDRVTALFDSPDNLQQARDRAHLKILWKTYKIWSHHQNNQHRRRMDTAWSTFRKERLRLYYASRRAELAQDWIDMAEFTKAADQLTPWDSHEAPPLVEHTGTEWRQWFLKSAANVERQKSWNKEQGGDQIDHKSGKNEHKDYLREMKKQGLKPMTLSEEEREYGHIYKPVTYGAASEKGRPGKASIGFGGDGDFFQYDKRYRKELEDLQDLHELEDGTESEFLHEDQIIEDMYSLSEDMHHREEIISPPREMYLDAVADSLRSTRSDFYSFRYLQYSMGFPNVRLRRLSRRKLRKRRSKKDKRKPKPEPPTAYVPETASIVKTDKGDIDLSDIELPTHLKKPKKPKFDDFDPSEYEAELERKKSGKPGPGGPQGGGPGDAAAGGGFYNREGQDDDSQYDEDGPRQGDDGQWYGQEPSENDGRNGRRPRQ